MRRKRRLDDELNFWQPTSDLMSALLYMMMLIILLLGLYLMHIPEHDQLDPHAGNTFASGDDGGDGGYPSPTPFYSGGAGGGGGGGDGREDGEGTEPGFSESPSPSPTTSPTPTPDNPGSGGGAGGGTGGGGGSGDGPGESPDEGMKSAVYVMMIDAETDRTIKEEGVEFELYSYEGALQILNTYYPLRQTFRSYLTTEAGTFYFPEKLFSGVYELHELSEPEGYDAAANQRFVLDSVYDWPDPYVVRVPLFPSRNIVRVQLTDAKTGMPVSGGTFDVIADEDIYTADGTLRYRLGQVVDEIVCDEEGYGVSQELYLGHYRIRQHEIPAFYASYTDEIETEVNKRSKVEPTVNGVACERTVIELSVVDELYPTRGVEGAVLSVRSANAAVAPFTVTTDYTGRAILDELEKGTTYRITQLSTTGDYQPDTVEHSISIAADGRINGEAETALALTNRVIRVNIGITDELSSVQIPGVSLSLYTEDGELLRTWTSSGSTQGFTSLKPGSYYVLINGDTEKQYSVTVRDTAKVQEINIHTTDTMRYVAYGAVTALGLIVLILVISAIRKRRKNRQV